MPLPYTGSKGELNFEADVIARLQQAGWGEVLRNKTPKQLEENWRLILFDRNMAELNGVPLSDYEMDQVMELVRTEANTPVKSNQFINGRHISIIRDSDSADTVHRGKPVYLDLFSAREIAGGSSRYQIAEQVDFETGHGFQNRRGDLTLLINGMPVIHIELKASGVSVDEATTQIKKYAQEGIWTGIYSFVQVFFAITPEDTVYFANPGKYTNYMPEFYFHWGDRNNNYITNWQQLILSENSILSIPEAHKLIGYYTVADSSKDVLKVCRSYQYTAIKAIVSRCSKQVWGDHDQLGGFVWCTTGGGKTITSFKSGQLIIDMNLADKVVFVVDRQALDAQSLAEYNSFERPGEFVVQTTSTRELFHMLKSDAASDHLIMTSIQKLSNISKEDKNLKEVDIKKILEKRIVFIVDEAHRSQFGEMHQAVKNMFYHALFFGFTGTPIFSENLKQGEMTTETVFGRVLSVYSLASGIKDKNVLGFWPEKIETYNSDDLKKEVALRECNAHKEEDIDKTDKVTYARYKKLRYNTPMATTYEDDGATIKEKGIEDYLPGRQYNNDNHRNAVVDSIIDRFPVLSTGEQGTRFSALLATTSIPEAIEYYHLFKKKAPDMNVSIIFDTSTAGNSESVIAKNEAIVEILDDYSQKYGLALDKSTDPELKRFKDDLMARLAHRKPYNSIGNDHEQLLDLVIVVDQLLTGFDSQYLNTLYLDKVLEYDGLIQAISRTNRVYSETEKPWGLVKFYRKPYTMERNLEEALRVYCMGEKSGVQVADLNTNLKEMSVLFSNIEKIFALDKVDNFERLPKQDEYRQKFRKEFLALRAKLRAAFLQGFKWNNEYAKLLPFDEKTYRILKMRYEDLPSGRSGGGGKVGAGFAIDTDVSFMEMEKIDADYLEKQFQIITIAQIEAREDSADRQAAAIREIRDNLNTMPVHLQKWARMVLHDIERGFLIVQKGRTFRDYIAEYASNTVRDRIKKEAGKFNIDPERLLDVYRRTSSEKDINDQSQLTNLEDSANMGMVAEYFGCSQFKARVKLDSYLTDFILNRKADEADE